MLAISCISAIPFMQISTVASATEQNSSKLEKKIVSPVKRNVNQSKWLDLNNDGLVDKDKLTPQQHLEDDKRTKETQDFLQELSGKKFQLKAAEKQLVQLDQENASETYKGPLKAKIKKLEKEILETENGMETKIGLKKKKAQQSLVSTDSSGYADITLSSTIYEDFWSKGKWLMDGDWEWLNDDYRDEGSGTGNLGKNDGFALRVDEDIDVYSHSASTFWSYDGSKSNPEFFDFPSSSNNGWKWQDVIANDVTATGLAVKSYNSGYLSTTLSVKFEDPTIGDGDTVELGVKYAHTLVPIDILGVVDPDGDPISIEITKITEDEPVNEKGSGKKEVDGEGIETNQAIIRGERSGKGNGRVYHITFVAKDDKGAESVGTVVVGVRHDNGINHSIIDDGQKYLSTAQ